MQVTIMKLEEYGLTHQEANSAMSTICLLCIGSRVEVRSVNVDSLFAINHKSNRRIRVVDLDEAIEALEKAIAIVTNNYRQRMAKAGKIKALTVLKKMKEK